MTKISKNIDLTEEELNAIENGRKNSEKVERFKNEYQKLVNETGFAWVIDTSSPLNNLRLGISKITQ